MNRPRNRALLLLAPLVLSPAAMAQQPNSPASSTPPAPPAGTTPPAQPAPPQPPACTTPEHRQFDFWIGRWDVYRADNNALVAHSLIERMYDGCAIRENWMPHGRAGGGSLSNYNRAHRRWHQTWVDSANSYAVFVGGMEGEAMVITGTWYGINGPGTSSLARMTYTREPEGAVLQRVDTSADGGRTWTQNPGLLYRPAANHLSTTR